MNFRREQNKIPNFWLLLILPIFLLFNLLGWAAQSMAASPPTIFSYQGKLLIGGSAVTTSIGIKLVIYDQLTGGTAVYTASGTLPSSSTVTITPDNGLFSINLGDTTGSQPTNSFDANLFKNNSELYLEVVVNDQTLSPRKRVTAMPYAFSATYSVTSTYAESASTSTYSSSAGTSTYASTAGYSDTASNTMFLGGLASSSFILKAGDFMTGPFSIYSNLTVTGTTNLSYATTSFNGGIWGGGGSVGIGTTTPIGMLEIVQGTTTIFQSGNTVITNLNGINVRYSNRLYTNDIGVGASETAAAYFKIDPVGALNQQVGIYGEITANQEDTEAAFAKVVHFGNGDAFYTALRGNSAAGYEAASFVDGTKGVISTMQVAGLGNSVLFDALWDQTTTPNYGMYYADQAPARALTIRKYTTAPDGLEQIRLVENNLGRNRFAVYNNGDMIIASATSTSGTTTVNSPDFTLRGAYWDGAQSVDRNVIFREVVTGAADSVLRILIGSTAAPSIEFILSSTSLDLQSNTIVGLGGITMKAGGGNLDLQGGKIIGNLLFNIDNNYNIGSSTTSRPLNVYMSGNVLAYGVGNNYFAGKIGIGTSSPDYLLQVVSTTITDLAKFSGSGSTQCTVVAGTGWSCSSDERLKTNISTIGNGLDKILVLRGVSYNWLGNPRGTPMLGFIAQEVESTLPDLVSTDSSGFKSLNITGVVPVLVEAIKTLESKIKDLTIGLASFSTSTIEILSLETNPLVLNQKIVFKNHVVLGADTVGQVTIPPNSTSTFVTFASEFDSPPVVIITPQDFVVGHYKVTATTTFGFEIELDDAQNEAIRFNWLVFGWDRPTPLEVGIVSQESTVQILQDGTMGLTPTTTVEEFEPVSSSSLEVESIEATSTEIISEPIAPVSNDHVSGDQVLSEPLPTEISPTESTDQITPIVPGELAL